MFISILSTLYKIRMNIDIQTIKMSQYEYVQVIVSNIQMSHF
jgi:hypothetical protein